MTRAARRWSFTSKAMAVGSLHKRKNFPDPVINAAIFFHTCPSKQACLDLVVPKLLEFERFAGVFDLSTCKTKFLPDLDTSQMVREIQIDGTEQATLDCIQDHLHDPVSGRGDLPWWELLLIENIGSGQSCCVWRVHHSLGDGLALVGVIEEILENADGTEMGPIVPDKMTQKFKRRQNIFVILWKIILGFIQVLTLPTGTPDTDTAFSLPGKRTMHHTQQRKFVILPTTPLDLIRAMKSKANVTLNDIIYTALSQAIHDYIKHEDGHVPTDIKCRSLIPVAFPRPKAKKDTRSRTLRNKWCFMEADMGLGCETLQERLSYISHHLSLKKRSMIAPVQLGLQNSVARILPTRVNQSVVYRTMFRRSIIFSNVPGPVKRCLFAGQEATGVQMFFSNLLTQTGFLSYAGQVFGNLVLDVRMKNANLISKYYGKAICDMATELGIAIPDELREYDLSWNDGRV